MIVISGKKSGNRHAIGQLTPPIELPMQCSYSCLRQL
jgi:hypothetical protein